jgi:hypothetical protein
MYAPQYVARKYVASKYAARKRRWPFFGAVQNESS